MSYARAERTCCRPGKNVCKPHIRQRTGVYGTQTTLRNSTVKAKQCNWNLGKRHKQAFHQKDPEIKASYMVSRWYCGEISLCVGQHCDGDTRDRTILAAAMEWCNRTVRGLVFS